MSEESFFRYAIYNQWYEVRFEYEHVAAGTEGSERNMELIYRTTLKVRAGRFGQDDGAIDFEAAPASLPGVATALRAVTSIPVTRPGELVSGDRAHVLTIFLLLLQASGIPVRDGFIGAPMYEFLERLPVDHYGENDADNTWIQGPPLYDYAAERKKEKVAAEQRKESEIPF